MSTLTTQQAMSLALQHHRAGQFADAESIYRQVLAVEPENTDALHLLGLLAIQFKKPQTAVELIGRAVAVNPNAHTFHDSLGQALAGCGRIDGAIAEYRRAIEIQPSFVEARDNLAAALIRKGEFEEASIQLRRALEFQPDLIDAISDLGGCQCELGRLDDAIATYRSALVRRPDLPRLHYNLGTALLLKGDLPAGFAEYEYRWEAKNRTMPSFAQPHWDGGQLQGRRILIFHEQGYGDTIQFARYLPLVAQRGGKVAFWCPTSLERLMQSMPQIDQLVPGDQTPSDFDIQCPLLRLPLLFSTTLETVPAAIPYLHADPDLSDRWKQRIGPSNARAKVGLVWAGRPEHKDDHKRSLSLGQLVPLASIPGIRFFSLQFGRAAAEAQTAPQGMDLTDWTGELTDFGATAALLENLDLLITVDTAAAHLAGALGKPVWLLLPFVPDWRWLMDREDSPWYPTMRLFRQTSARDWTGPVNQVAKSLKQRMGER